MAHGPPPHNLDRVLEKGTPPPRTPRVDPADALGVHQNRNLVYSATVCLALQSVPHQRS